MGYEWEDRCFLLQNYGNALKRGARITGIVPQEAVTGVDVHWIGATAVELIYKTPTDG